MGAQARSGGRRRPGRPRWPVLALLATSLALQAMAVEAGNPPPGAPPSAPATEPETGKDAQRTDAVTHPTKVHLPGGPTTLAAVLERLSANGNATQLAAGIDPATPLDLPPIDGTYWQALMAVCAACDLVLGGTPVVNAERAGLEVQEAMGRLRVSIPVQRGTVLLVRRGVDRPRLLAEAHGVLLVVVEEVAIHQSRFRGHGDPAGHWATLCLRVLIEPHVAEASIGSAVADFEARGTAGGQALALELDPQPAEGSASGWTRLLLPQVPALTALQLNGQLTIEIAETTVLHASLRPGAAVTVNHQGVQVGMRLIDGETAKHESRRGAGVTCTYAADAVTAEPVLHISSAGQDVPVTNAFSERHDLDTEETLLLAQEPQAQDYAITAEFAFRRGSVELPLDCSIDLSSLPSAEAKPDRAIAIQRPSPVSWPAGRVALKTILGHVRQDGNQVLLELGVDESRELELPAFAGSFWEGLLTLCRAYDLTILATDRPAPMADDHDDNLEQGAAAATAIAVDGGPVCLGHARSGRPGIERMHACGPLLTVLDASDEVTTRGRLGVERTVNLSCRVRMEPRMGALHLRDAGVLWHAFAEVDGKSLPVRRPLVMRREMQLREGVDPGLPHVGPVGDARTDSEPWELAIGGVGANAAHVRVDGLLIGQFEQPVETSLTIAPGQHQGVRLGQHALMVTFLDLSAAQAQGFTDAAILVGGGEAMASELRLDLRTAAGEHLPARGRDTRTRQGLEFVWMFQGIAAANHQVVLTADEPFTRISQPITISADLP